jgi:proton glutamate symport protein
MNTISEKKKLGISEQTMIGLGLGLATGLFFGELAAPLKYLGDAFIGLLQMTVLPYIVLALMGGIGKLTGAQSRLLLGRVALIILFFWFVGYMTVLLFGLSLPSLTSASFFSSSLVTEPRSFDFLSLFIPSNPFRSLAENQVPAVVLFSVLCGAAIIGMSNKNSILQALDTMQDVLGRVTGFVVSLSGFGVFCIVASAAGTMNIEEMVRIQGYLVLMTVFTLAICFLLVPALVTTLTPFKSKDISPLLRASFILAFAIGKTLIVLPMLIEGIREIFEKQAEENQDKTNEINSTIEVLVPLSYSFPHLGRILATAFIPFAGWYVGQPLPLDMYPILFGAGLFVHFSTAPVSIPFMLDLVRLPSDLFQLFLVTGVYMGRLSDAVGASYILAVTVLGACAVNGMLKIQLRRLGLLAMGILAVSVVLVIAGRLYIDLTSSDEYHKDKVVASMQLPQHTAEGEIVEPGPNPVPLTAGQSHFQRIFDRGVIRVGFDPDHLPFSYINQAGDLAGFDVELVSALAMDLGVSVEMVPIGHRGAFHEEMHQDFYDIAVGGFVDTVQLARRSTFSEPYLYLNMALVVPDHRKREFADLNTIAETDGLRVAYIAGSGLDDEARRYFPNATIVSIASPRKFFAQAKPGAVADVLLLSAESGSAWSMLYPAYQVATPFTGINRLPLVIPYAAESDPELDEFLDNWVMLKRNDGTIDKAYQYWILGEGTEPKEPRWSVIRDVLGWVD